MTELLRNHSDNGGATAVYAYTHLSGIAPPVLRGIKVVIFFTNIYVGSLSLTLSLSLSISLYIFFQFCHFLSSIIPCKLLWTVFTHLLHAVLNWLILQRSNGTHIRSVHVANPAIFQYLQFYYHLHTNRRRCFQESETPVRVTLKGPFQGRL